MRFFDRNPVRIVYLLFGYIAVMFVIVIALRLNGQSEAALNVLMIMSMIGIVICFVASILSARKMVKLMDNQAEQRIGPGHARYGRDKRKRR